MVQTVRHALTERVRWALRRAGVFLSKPASLEWVDVC
jgi:hypothetical protein